MLLEDLCVPGAELCPKLDDNGVLRTVALTLTLTLTLSLTLTLTLSLTLTLTLSLTLTRRAADRGTHGQAACAVLEPAGTQLRRARRHATRSLTHPLTNRPSRRSQPAH